MTNPKRSPSAAAITAARARALATIAGEYVPPAPVKAKSRSRFNQSFGKVPREEPALYGKGGAPVGPPRRSSQKRET